MGSAVPLKRWPHAYCQFNIMVQTHAERAALKRNVTVEEVGNSALFLCSDLSSGITGEIVYVDAGYRFMGM